MREPNDNMRMVINPRRSFFTLLLFSCLVEFSSGWVLADPNPETERLENDLAAARNALDAEILQKGPNPNDPAIKEKTAAVEERQKTLKRHFENSVTRSSKPGSANPSSSFSSNEASEDRRPPEPETVLSGKEIQGEIQYSKKSKKPTPTGRATERVTPPSPQPEEDAVSLPNPASGQSEIQYPKKSPKKLKSN